MGLITSVLGSLIGTFLKDRAYWAVKLSTGKWCCELDSRLDVTSGLMRPFDWTKDLVDMGDASRIKELWMFCPPSAINPLGSTARLPIVEPETAFQFKVSNIDAFGSWGRAVASQVIGRVDDKVTGACTYFVYDTSANAMSTPMRSSVYAFGSWREGIAPIGPLSHRVLGLDLT